MKKLSLVSLIILLVSCASYPKVAGMAPEKALKELASYEALLDEGEDNIRNGPAIPVPAGGIIAIGEALTPAMDQVSLNAIAKDRARLKADREAIYRANPNLRPAKPVRVAGSTKLTLAGQCRFAQSVVTDQRRLALYNEAKKGGFPQPFQTQQQISAEIASIGGATCSQFGQQIDAILVSYRASVTASDKLVNGSPWGLQCAPNGSASRQASCTALATLYSAHSFAAACHQQCN